MTVINTNVKAIVAQDSMRSVNLKLATAMERLSTGLRINSAKDDAAGLAISERMNAQVRGFGMAIKNANDGLSMAQTADGAYGEVTSMLQRMRELAVQAANGAMGPLDRRSLQLEIEELKTEIENVATKTHFNNITLLDGTAKNVNLQIGANQGDTMEIGFDSARIKDIGSGLRPALTSLGGNADAFDKLEAGDLVLNGVLVPASIAPDDNLSFSGETLEANKAIEIAASAIAKAAAINKTTEQSNVYALVNETLVQGNTMTAPAAATSAANVLINGIATRDLALTTDNEINRVALVTAINDISSQTGVRAINTGSDANGITLVADDGRNITVQFSAADFTVANTGISGSTTAVTYVGSYSLYSTRGEPITVEQQIGRDITGSGLQIGVFQPDMATTVTFERSGAGVVDDGGTDGARVPLGNGETPSIDNVGVLNGATLVINDITIDAARATDDSASHTASDVTASAKSASAIATAAAINKKSDLHGVTAVAEPNVIRSEEEQSFTAGSTGSINLNGVAISVSTVSRNAVLETINAYSGQTGVVARAYGEGMELVAEDGRNIVIAIDSSTITAANLGLANVTLGTGTDDSNGVVFYSSVRLTSEKEFTVARGSEGGANFQKLGFREGTFGGTNTGTKIADVDVSSQAGAQEAITAIDAALEDVSAAQARSGAYQNRLDAVINVLSESTENITASRSRILDADYALEATNMAKAQIISQAANAMLAQANQSQQSVLQLLQ
jgi:flagellin